MRARLAAVALVLTAALAVGTASAEPVGQRAEFSMLGGYTIFDKDRNVVTNRELKDALYLGGRLSWQFPSGSASSSPAASHRPRKTRSTATTSITCTGRPI